MITTLLGFITEPILVICSLGSNACAFMLTHTGLGMSDYHIVKSGDLFESRGYFSFILVASNNKASFALDVDQHGKVSFWPTLWSGPEWQPAKKAWIKHE